MPHRPLLNKEASMSLAKDRTSVYPLLARNLEPRGFSMKASGFSKFIGAIYTESGYMPVQFKVEGGTVGAPELLSFGTGNYGGSLYPTMGAWVGDAYLSLWGEDSYAGTMIYGFYAFDPVTGGSEYYEASDEVINAVLNASTAAYDYLTESMWVYAPEINAEGTAFTGNYYLYELAMSGAMITGEQGAFVTGLPEGNFFSIMIDKEGQMYGLGTNGSLYSVDKESGLATEIGSTGIEVLDAQGQMYEQTATYDYAGNRIIWNYILSDGSEVGIATVDKATAAITKLTDDYYQLSALASVYYEDPSPMPVEDLALSWTAGHLTATFTAPSMDQNGNVLASLAKAELYRLNGNQLELEETLDNPVPGQVCTITHPTSESGLQTYAVRVTDANGKVSAYASAQVSQIEIPLPYTNGFEDDETEAMAALTISDPLGTGGMERTQDAAYEGEWSFKLTSNYNSDGRELILSGIPVEKGATYSISFYASAPDAGYYDVLYLVMDGNYGAAQYTYLYADWAPISMTYLASRTGQLSMSLLALNEAVPVYIDNIEVRELSGPDVPAELSVNGLSPAAEGKMSAILNLTLPATTMAGESLTAIEGVVVEYSDYSYFNDFGSDTVVLGLTPGATADFEVEVSGEAGEYYFRAYAYNEAGACPVYAYYGSASTPVRSDFIGTDELSSLSVETEIQADGSVVLTWKPVEGRNDGYIGDVSYSLLLGEDELMEDGQPELDQATSRFRVQTPVLSKGMHTLELSASTADAEVSKTVHTLAGWNGKGMVSNVGVDGKTSPYVLWLDEEEANSGFSQTIYPASGRAMYIDTLVLFVEPMENGETAQHTKIYMGTTDMDAFSGGYFSDPDFVEREALHLVYDDILEIEAGISMLALPLKGFYYDGEDNLLIHIVKPMQDPALAVTEVYVGESEDRMFKYRYPASTSIDFDTVALFNEYTGTASYEQAAMMVMEEENLKSLQVTVLDAEDEQIAIEDAELHIYNDPAAEKGHIDVKLRTDASGQASFAYMPAGRFYVVGRKAGFIENEPVLVEINAESVSPVEVVVRMLEAEELQLRGVVKDENGDVLADVAVAAEGLASFYDTTDAAGQFHLENIYGPSDYVLHFSKAGMQSLSMDFLLADKDSVLADVTMRYVPDPVSFASAELVENEAVKVVWKQPGAMTEISWTIGDSSEQSLTVDQKSAFKYGQRFLPEDLDAYGIDSLLPLQIGFVPGSETARYNLVIAQGEVGTREIFRKAVDSRDLTAHEWYFANVTGKVAIDREEELWLIVEVEEGANQGYACDVTFGGAVEGKGNLFCYDGQWYELPDLFTYTTGNVLVSLKVADMEQQREPVNGYRVYRGLSSAAFEDYTMLTQEPLMAEYEYVDESFSALSFGQYRYAVVTDWYNGNLSSPVYTNVLNKDMEMDLSFEIASPAGSAQGASILLANEDDIYSTVADADGKAVIADVWRGDYELTVNLPYHQSFVSDISVAKDSTIKIALQEVIVDPIILSASVNGKDATLTYGVNAYNWSDDIESYPDFAIENLGEWILLGGGEKGGMQSSDEEAFVWPNMEAEQSFIVYNDNEVMPEPLGWPAYSGERCLLAMYRFDGEANNDYVVRPIQQGGGIFSFYVRGAQSSDEEYSVVYSTTGAEMDDFKAVEGWEGVMAPLYWSLVSVEIPEEAKYIGIRYESEYLYGLQLDDLSYHWDAPANPTGYELYVDGVLAAEVGADATTYTFADLESGEHDLGVVAVYASGKSERVETTVEISDEAMPVDLAVSVEVTADGGKATLTWKAAEGFSPESYKVYLGEELKAENLTETTYVFEGLDNGEYTAAVVAVYATGESEKATKDFEVKGVGNESSVSMADAALYPNPSDGHFYISVPKACRMQLYSISGRLLGQEVLDAGLKEFDLQSLPAGTYYVRLIAANEAVVLKAVVR